MHISIFLIFLAISSIALFIQRIDPNVWWKEIQAKFNKTPPSSGPGYDPGMKMSEYWREAERLGDEGEFQEALKRYIWFFNHCLYIDPRQYGSRLSFFLSSWVELGKKHKPALRALKKIRDKDMEYLLKGKGDKFTFHDVISINWCLNGNEKTMDFFKTIDKLFPDLAESCWWLVKKYFFETRDLETIKRYYTDLFDEYAHVKKRIEKAKHDIDDVLSKKMPRDDAEWKELSSHNEIKETFDYLIESEAKEFEDITICFIRILFETKQYSRVLEIGNDAISLMKKLELNYALNDVKAEISRYEKLIKHQK